MTNFIEAMPVQAKTVEAKTILIKEGEQSQHIFLIKKGCIRVWFNHNGRDVTTQFFFEGDAVTSLESFMYGQPSMYTIETIEPCELAVMKKADFDSMLADKEGFKDWFYQTLLQKLIIHSHRLLSFIKNKPKERYLELVEEHPDIIRRIPQHYIASYLGITSVSLSRIRNRKIP